MEFAAGGDLFEYISKETRLAEKESCRILQQILSAISYLHTLKIVHRDIKPENLLLDINNNVKLADFGLGNLYNAGEMLKTACGSPCYAAPEMVAGKKYCPLSVDIYSCGVVLFVMLTGDLPFDDPNTGKLYKKIMAGDYKIPDYVSSEGKEILIGMLMTNPKKRFTIEDIEKHSWNQIFKQKLDLGIVKGYHRVMVDMEVIEKLRGLNIDSKAALKDLENSKHNNNTAAYYLLHKKIRTESTSRGVSQEKLLEIDDKFNLSLAVTRHNRCETGYLYKTIDLDTRKKKISEIKQIPHLNSFQLPVITRNTPRRKREIIDIPPKIQFFDVVEEGKIALVNIQQKLQNRKSVKKEQNVKIISKNFKVLPKSQRIN